MMVHLGLTVHTISSLRNTVRVIMSPLMSVCILSLQQLIYHTCKIFWCVLSSSVPYKQKLAQLGTKFWVEILRTRVTQCQRSIHWNVYLVCQFLQWRQSAMPESYLDPPDCTTCMATFLLSAGCTVDILEKSQTYESGATEGSQKGFSFSLVEEQC